MENAGLPIGLDDVRAAAERLRGVANRTPVMTSRTFDALAGDGTRVFFKCENYQRVGAFKFRGAYNHIASLAPEERARGIVATSSGNHAQGVALACRLLGAPATILMPSDAPATKLAATRGYGATVVLYDREKTYPETFVQEYATTHDLHWVPAYDDPLIMAGQGTAALELVEEVGALDFFLAPMGGGGLMSGCATAVKGLLPGTKVFGVETEGADDWVRSLARGERVMIDPPATIADGIRTRQPGVRPFAQCRALLDGVVVVSDEEVREAMRFMVTRMKMLVEPTGAVAAAAVMAGKLGDLAGKRVGVIVSGGNVDPDVLCEVLTGA
ncbi:MAG: pyridoxal-phosphate dependent enzyme [Chloroflexi bacterium]|nr:pyridoxal-phosphate dependent enzyme [Chloroflexota bacterium]